MSRKVKRVNVTKGGFAAVAMTHAVYEVFDGLDATRRAQLLRRMKALAEHGPSALSGDHFNPKEGNHAFPEMTFRMAAFKTHQVRLYGCFCKERDGSSIFVIGDIDTKKKANKARPGVIERAARLTYEAAQHWRLI